MHLIELKCGKNKNVGVISETLFYSQILYQVCVDQKDIIMFGSWGKGGDQRGIEHLKKKKYRQIALHYLAEQFHPLFDQRVLSLINEGLVKWSTVADKVTYDYHAKRIF